MSMEIFYGMFWKEPKFGILFHGTSTVHTYVAPRPGVISPRRSLDKTCVTVRAFPYLHNKSSTAILFPLTRLYHCWVYPVTNPSPHHHIITPSVPLFPPLPLNHHFRRQFCFCFCFCFLLLLFLSVRNLLLNNIT